MRLALLALLLAAVPARAADPDGWVDLMTPGVWKSFDARWVVADDATLDPANPKKLVAVPAGGSKGGKVWVNGPGRVGNLLTEADYGDCEIALDFLIAKGSNAGVKFEAVYEIQIVDSFGKKGKLTGNDLGGIYPRAKLEKPYGYLDDGTPPTVNAAKPPGEWNTLTAVWRAPKFDAAGRKTTDGVMARVTINGRVVQENAACKTATGSNWKKPEKPAGPFMIQTDHGPTAIRAAKVRPLPAGERPPYTPAVISVSAAATASMSATVLNGPGLTRTRPSGKLP